MEVDSGVGVGALHPWDVSELKSPESQAEVPFDFLALKLVHADHQKLQAVGELSSTFLGIAG